MDITIWPKNAPSTTSQVTVTKGDTITISLNGTSSPSQAIAPGQPVWKYRQLNSDGTYTAWQAMGPNCTGNQFDYTTTTSGIFQVEAVFFGDDADAVQYVRQQDDIYSCHSPGGTTLTLHKGDPDAFGVTSTQTQITIRLSAGGWLGSTSYAMLGPSPDFDPLNHWLNQYKCNLFVADMCDYADAPVPNINGNYIGTSPPSADQWSGVDPVVIPGWKLLPLNTKPEPGFVVAKGQLSGDGHCGIVDYDGQWISAGKYWVNRYANFANERSEAANGQFILPAGQNIYENGQ